MDYQYQGDNWHAGANFYYMDYDNQLAQTGQLSDMNLIIHGPPYLRS